MRLSRALAPIALTFAVVAMPLASFAATPNMPVTVKALETNPTKYLNKTVTVHITVGWVYSGGSYLWSGNDNSGSSKCVDMYKSNGTEKVGDKETVTGPFVKYTSKTGKVYYEIDPTLVKKTGTGKAPKC